MPKHLIKRPSPFVHTRSCKLLHVCCAWGAPTPHGRFDGLSAGVGGDERSADEGSA